MAKKDVGSEEGSDKLLEEEVMEGKHVAINIAGSGSSTNLAPDSAAVMKYVSLLCLTVQNAVNSVAIRYSRVRPPGDRYATSTVIFWSEVLKLLGSAFLTVFSREGGGLHSLRNVFSHPGDALRVSVPSFVYVLQNNLLFVAASNLDVGTYQISYQLKILATAGFFVAMLRRRITALQWVSLVILTAGVGLVQLAQVEGATKKQEAQGDDRLFGFLCILGASCLSGFAGVYFEKVLKGSHVSVWVRNFQMSLISCPLALITCYVKEGDFIQSRGFNAGYDWLVVAVIMMTGLGGLIVAVVIKYADNILKGFATSVAIVVGCLANAFLFDVSVSGQFIVGTTCVLTAVWLYGYKPNQSS